MTKTCSKCEEEKSLELAAIAMQARGLNLSYTSS